MANYKKVNVSGMERAELHDQLELTGTEISVNFLPAGAGVPFIHAHKKNEEVYIILEGEGFMALDGERVHVAAGDFIRVSPAAKRQIAASDDTAVRFLCVQAKAGSLEGYTMTDAEVLE